MADENPSPTDGTNTTKESPTSEEVKSKPVAPSPDAKVEILLKPAGNAPILSNKKWVVERLKKVSAINAFVRKLLKSEPADSLFLYVNQSFAPAPDADIGTLYDCFGANGKLILHYCTTQAWG